MCQHLRLQCQAGFGTILDVQHGEPCLTVGPFVVHVHVRVRMALAVSLG